MVKERQTERIGIRFTPSEARMLSELSDLTGMGMTDIVRQAVRREYSERIGAPTSITKKTKKR